MSQFPAVIDLSTLNGTNGFTLIGADIVDNSGRSVASAGDINGDGFDDFIIGANNANPIGIEGAGASYILFGKPFGFTSEVDLGSLDGTNGFRLNGIADSDHNGISVASAGDLNGDGFDDVIVGSYGAPGGAFDGEAYVFFGKASGFASSFNLSKLDGHNGFRLKGLTDSFAGTSVASAGDLNGDGIDDIVIGAFHAAPAGETYVIFGKRSAFSKVIELSTLNGTNGFKLVGVDTGDRSGHSVSSAGDVNGDGINDLLIGAWGADSFAGESYVVFGKATGFGATLDLSILDGTNGFRLQGANTNDTAGYSVASAGDVNGDGFADLIIGASGASPGSNAYAGTTYVVFGKADWSTTATVDLGALAANEGFRMDGLNTDDFSGTSVASAGDVNGDGFDDVIVGASGANSYAGASYVVFGKADWSSTTAIDLSALDGTDGFRLDGIDASDHSGDSVASAGDINGDGFADLIIGANEAGSGTKAAAGESYVVFGRLPDTTVTLTGTAASQTLAGGDQDDTLSGLAGNDSLWGHDGHDVLSGGDDNDLLNGGKGADDLDGGAGIDAATYRSAATGVVVDLTTPSNNAGEATGDTFTSIENLIGSMFGDTLVGDGGNNVLTGGLGKDLLTGNLGTDIFDFDFTFETKKGEANRDEIADFTRGEDHIDLQNIDAKSKTYGNQKFKFIGSHNFDHKAGELHFIKKAGFVLVEGDVNGDGRADFQIEVHGVHKVSGGDFIL
jgi:Ca2+-binding RTX toxin-like protein